MRLAAAINSHRRGDVDDAIASYRSYLQVDPANFDCLRLLGAALHDRCRFSECLEFLGKAVAMRPDFAECWHHLAEAQFQLGRYAECADSYGRVLALSGDPRGTVYYWRARALKELGHQAESREAVELALARGRQWAERSAAERPAAQCLIGLTLMRLGRGEEALQAVDAALALEPARGEAWLDRGIILTEALHRHQEALDSVEHALALQPAWPVAWYNKGVTLERMFRLPEALACFERTIALRSDIDAELHRLACLNDMGQHPVVVEQTDKFLGADPAAYRFWFVRGWALIYLRRFEEGVQSLWRAHSLRPDDRTLHVGVATALLLSEDFEAGWRHYADCLDRLEVSTRPQDQGRRWNGEADIDGCSILLFADQGLGDTIQFARYVSMVAARGARVTIEAQPALHALLQSIGAPVELVASGQPGLRHDLNCPISSLPFAFQTRIDTIPSAVPYLRAVPARVDAWRRRLDAVGLDFRVGLVCSGNPANVEDSRRSIPLEALEPLVAQPGCSFYLLQPELRAEDERFLVRCGRIADHRAELTDFGETAAMVECMDLVISVDTSVAHLAGALARPLWLLLPFLAEWRWMMDREDSPWYPTARLFRQRSYGDWASAVGRAGEALGALLATGTTSPCLSPRPAQNR